MVQPKPDLQKEAPFTRALLDCPGPNNENLKLCLHIKRREAILQVYIDDLIESIRAHNEDLKQ